MRRRRDVPIARVRLRAGASISDARRESSRLDSSAKRWRRWKKEEEEEDGRGAERQGLLSRGLVRVCPSDGPLVCNALIRIAVTVGK